MRKTTPCFLLFFVLFASIVASCQATRYDGQALLDTGRPAPSAIIRVCTPASPSTAAVPCTSLVTAYSDSALSVTTNPVTADSFGRFHFYLPSPQRVDVQFSGTGLTTFTMQDVQVTNAASLNAITLTSSSSNPAGTGVIKLASGDGICWRNNANSADICISKSGTLSGNVPADVLDASGFGGVKVKAMISNTASPAASGLVRAALADLLSCWRNAAGTTDVCTSDAGAAGTSTGNLADLFKWAGGGFQGGAYVDNSAGPAQSGVERTGNNVCAVGSRNVAGTGDVCAVQVDGNNVTVIGATSGAKTASVADTSSNPAQSGVERTGNNVCAVSSRNAGNTADVCAVQVDGSNITQLGGSAGTNLNGPQTGAQYIEFSNQTAPSNPATGKIRVYGDSGTGNITCRNSTGGSCLSATATAPFISTSANPASTGVLRTANNECAVESRNAANSADVCAVQVDASNNVVMGTTRTPTFQSFTSSGTFTIPAGVTAVKATISAAGGAGGGATSTNNGGGGGSGGTSVKWLSGLTPGNTITVTVGAAGAAASGTTGGAGGNSSISSGTQTITTVTANGGSGGNANGAQSAGGAGGVAGSNGDINFGGSSGIYGTGAVGGAGAGSIWGGGGPDSNGGNPGNAATAPGAGGGAAGAGATRSGGAGGTGLVIFEWWK